MERIHIGDLSDKNVGQKVVVKGWVDTVREHGKLVFLDIRDISGTIQTVVSAKNKEIFDEAKKLTKESSVSVEGSVNLRPKGTENDKVTTGKVELGIEKLEIYNICPPLPFELDNKEVGEEVRLKYRYLDLRRPQMQKNLKARAKLFQATREYLDSKNFTEIETPMLVKYTPGGARNFIVPSRTDAGKFWALPESPQLFKQLLMVAGMERYYQIARCLRDEDLRKDRQPEFTQIDIEMSFVNQEHIIELIEGLLKKIWKEVLNVDIKTPFPRMTYEDSMKNYGNDRPDMRKDKNNPYEYAFLWVVDFPLFQYSEEDKKYVANHHPFTSPNMEDFKKNPEKARSWAYDIVLNGVEIGGGSIRIHDKEVQQKVFEILKISKEDQEKKFKFLLDALKFGAPEHGGIAIGVDRLMQLILNAESIREVIAFPKNSDGRETMLEAPSEVSENQLKDLHIKLDLPKEKEKGKKS
ncbi:MAG: aspartate--tRNA ligase [Nanoarchaeota archaeon]|nr:aspartate--tRNA ligase [Nanoarchaeota archaeon]